MAPSPPIGTGAGTKSIGSLPLDRAAQPAANCKFGAGCTVEEPPREAAARTRNHPCYGEDAHHHFARLHLAVAPACNIQCHYCNRRYDCAAENRPGVTSERLSPEQALERALSTAARLPELSVIGIAGPGDPLANPGATLRTLELVHHALPDLTLCLATNGLALPDHVDALADLGLAHLTVTVNAVDPAVGERIHPWVYLAGRRWRGREGAALLQERQREGIRLAVARGMAVKVNTVLIPGVNDGHVAEVARTVRGLGALLHNVMPLLVAPEFETFYAKSGQRGPTDEELERARVACGEVRQMRHCRACRADAVGRLGEGQACGGSPAAGDGAEARRAHQEAVERRRAADSTRGAEALARLARIPAVLSARVAVATRGGGTVNEHFGHAGEFQIYDVDRNGARLVAVRRIGGGWREGEQAFEAALRALEGCAAVLVARIGRWPREALEEAGVQVATDRAGEPIEAALLGWFIDRARGAAAPGAAAVSGQAA